jgi:cyclophilin family peptidyl-prolyl cis-trans isomerase
MYVYLDISINKVEMGRLTFQLYNNELPITCENFRQLCTGENKDKSLTYKNCPIHRIVPKLMLHGGDITKHDGTGGCSIYGPTFNDEGFKYYHSIGALSMANKGPNTNGSQFFITTATSPHLDQKHVVFGKLVDGLELLKEIESYGTSTGKPTKEIMISHCGQLDKF